VGEISRQDPRQISTDLVPLYLWHEDFKLQP
jgi:hypothetical protein